jgi:hypothetical protein
VISISCDAETLSYCCSFRRGDVQIENGLAMLSFDGEHEVSLLLEPAPPTPFDTIVQSLIPLIANTAKANNAVTAAKEGDSNALGATNLGPEGPRSRNDAATAAAATADAAPATAELVRRDLEASGIVEEAFASEELKWRWRLVNVAVTAGTASGQRMSLPQLQYLRAELDFRMLHMRHAALVQHCLHQLQGAAAAMDTTEAVPGKSADCRMEAVGGDSPEAKATNGAVGGVSATVEGGTRTGLSLDEGRIVRICCLNLAIACSGCYLEHPDFW